jgi:hypothetical protein
VLFALAGRGDVLTAAIAGAGEPKFKPAKPTPEATRNARRDSGGVKHEGEIRERSVMAGLGVPKSSRSIERELYCKG